MKDKIIKNITDTVKVIDTTKIDYTPITEYAHLVENSIWTKAIQTALDEKKNVYIPDIGEEIVIDGSIFMDSNTNLKVDPNQVIRLKENSNVCMLRNRNMHPGNTHYIGRENPDTNITVTGGIWSTKGNKSLKMDKYGTILGAFAVMAFSNVEVINLTDIAFVDGSSYAIMVANCENFLIENINFENYDKDGIHINGATNMGIVRGLLATGIGDDIVALNAWDWCTSSHVFGNIENLLIENISGLGNEARLLSGRKIYPNGKTADCNIKNCVFRNLTGIYVFKMYCQPNCHNVTHKDKWYDYSPVCGNMENIYFENLDVPEVRHIGIADIPVPGIFSILADCKNINIADVRVSETLDELKRKNVAFVDAGPISATWKKGENPEDWGDFFHPDMCCTVEDITIENVTIAGEKTTDSSKLVRERQLEINPDYPNTTPAGGTGFGKINKVTVK